MARRFNNEELNAYNHGYDAGECSVSYPSKPGDGTMGNTCPFRAGTKKASAWWVGFREARGPVGADDRSRSWPIVTVRS